MKLSKKWDLFAVAFLLLVHLALMAGFLRVNCITIDEPVHIVGGFEILQNGGHTINPESGVFPQVWAALPISWKFKMPPSGTMETLHSDASYPYARHILFHENIGTMLEDGKLKPYDNLYDPSSYLFYSRLMMSLLSLACGLLIYGIARPLFGKVPALLTLTLYVFFPLYISNAPLATADMAVSLFFLASIYTFQRFLRNADLPNFLFCAAALILLILSKMSAVVIALIFLIMICMKSFSKSFIRVKLPGRKTVILNKTKEKLLLSFASCLLLGVLLFASIWMAYGFKYAFPKPPPNALIVRSFEDSMQVKGTVPSLVRTMKLDKILPQPFIYGFMHTYFHSQLRWSFLDGKTSYHGHTMFFPLAFLYKTPPPVILAFLLSIAAMICTARTPFGKKRFKIFLPYLIFSTIFLLFALNSKLNIGYRHLMPAITVFFPLTAFGFQWLFNLASRKKLVWLKLLPFLLCIWCIVECMAGYPYPLAYFSSLFGGPKQAYKHLVDSSLDWGQDTKNIRGEFEKQGIPLDGSVPISYAIFSSVPPPFIGLDNARHIFFATHEIEDMMFEFEPGYYAISATYLRGYSLDNYTNRLLLQRPDQVYDLRETFYKTYNACKRYGKLPANFTDDETKLWKDCLEYQSFRFNVMRRHFEKMKPEFHINYSIYVYKIDEEQLKNMLKDLIR